MPQFAPGEARIAIAPIRVAPSGLSCQAEIFLGPDEMTKVATSDSIPFTSIGVSQDVRLPVTMPDASGTYHVFIDIYAEGLLIAAYEATENVVIGGVPTTEILRPNAPGDESNLLPAPYGSVRWADVDDTSPDGDSTFVYCSLPPDYLRDLYELTAPGGTGIINWIKVWIYARRHEDATIGKARTAIKPSDTVYQGNEEGLTTSYAYYSTQYTNNPDTGLPWTWPQLEDLQAGIALYSYADPPSGAIHSRCTQVYVEVDYTP